MMSAAPEGDLANFFIDLTPLRWLLLALITVLLVYVLDRPKRR